MILVTYLLTILVLILNFYKHIIEGGDGRFEGSTAPVIDLGMYWFKYLNTVKITLEEYFIDSYVEEFFE